MATKKKNAAHNHKMGPWSDCLSGGPTSEFPGPTAKGWSDGTNFDPTQLRAT